MFFVFLFMTCFGSSSVSALVIGLLPVVFTVRCLPFASFSHVNPVYHSSVLCISVLLSPELCFLVSQSL